MAILDIKEKIEPYLQTATGHIKRMLSSKHVIMENGKDLEETVDILTCKVLYNNTSGTKANFELSDNVENYKYLEVFYGSDIWTTDTYPLFSVKIAVGWSVTGAILHFINQSNETNTALQLESRPLTFKGKVASMGTEKYVNFSTSAGSVSWNSTSTGHTKVYRVIGWE